MSTVTAAPAPASSSSSSFIDIGELYELVNLLQQTNKNNDKNEILKHHTHAADTLIFILTPHRTFGVSRKSIQKYETKNYPKYKKHDWVPEWWETMNQLAERKLTGHQAYEAVVYHLKQQDMINTNYRQLMINMLEKNLKCKVGYRQLQKAFPGKAVSFTVALAEKFSKHVKYMKQDPTPWFISRKLDGVRCIVDTSQQMCFSRTGNPFYTLCALENTTSVFKDQSTSDNKQKWIFDGEICIIKDGKEYFSQTVGAIKKKKEQLNNFVFFVFDILTHDEFYQKTSQLTFAERLQTRKHLIDLWMAKIMDTSSNISFSVQLVDQYPYTPETEAKLQHVANEKQWEGLMYRKGNEPYRGKRSRDILKWKEFLTEEFVVQDVCVGPMQYLDQKSQTMKETNMLTAVKINYKGHTVSVGSGFSIAQRMAFFRDPSKILGKTIEVQYFEETQDQNGNVSLRFPTIKYIWGKRRDC